MNEARRETHTTVCCAHPYFGFVCTPNAIIDFSDRVPAEFSHGAIAAIDGRGFRNTDVPETKSSDEFWIGLFGSSVAFGVPATDNEHTIAAELESRLIRGRRDGKRVRVINFAIPAGQQPQQFFVMAYYRSLLDGVVTFDGISEVIIPSCYNDGYVPAQFPYRPYYEELFGSQPTEEQVCEIVLAERENAAFRRRPAWQQKLLASFHLRKMAERRSKLASLQTHRADFRSMFRSRPEEGAEAVAAAGATSWARYTAMMHDVCVGQGIQALFAVQPIPDRDKLLTVTEQSYLDDQSRMVSIRSAGYDRVLRLAQDLREAGRPIVSFQKIFAGCTHNIYTDAIHFEDRGSAIVADHMAEWIGRMWSGFGE